ncbi:hypothetical protein Fmac_029044 [Flemingia macrophylla]|uniref:Uncharacterized protein n=1 Tax=Flemingia macrophylla TaxID=520843 RepID=A0ABD1LAP1_9FABA
MRPVDLGWQPIQCFYPKSVERHTKRPTDSGPRLNSNLSYQIRSAPWEGLLDQVDLISLTTQLSGMNMLPGFEGQLPFELETG